MKKKVVLGLTFLITNLAFSQIGTTKVAQTKEKNENAIYDSTKNFLDKNVNLYLGQELYLKGKADELRKYGYDGFLLDFNGKVFDKSNVYKCCDGFHSKYSDLEGKYFKVIEILKHPKSESYKSIYGSISYLKLEEKSSKDIVYFKFESRFEHSFPFIVVGFFEKQKKLLVGKQFVFQDYYLEGSSDIATGAKVPVITGQIWKTIDLTIDEQYYKLSLLLENSAGQKITVTLDDILRKSSKGIVFSKQDFEKYNKKFGKEKFDKILKGKVAIGMTKEMCKLSWGEPDKVNETISSSRNSEQWVYKDNYLYFDNGLLTTIQ
jgi:hypothetical protein